MKAVMISIRPEWCEKILSGEKTIEVRRSRPKLQTPFKCYIYCTKGNKETLRHGRVIAEFICDRISEYYIPQAEGAYAYYKLSEKSCVSVKQIADYANGKNVFGWHITNLKVYSEPEEITTFKRANRTECYFSDLGLAIPRCIECDYCNLKKAPQSWCYVEEIE